jgi:RNA 2',3'-cyclic 3'-phosphodiesterase
VRLFVAVELSPDVIHEVGEAADELRERCRRLAPHSRITWVTPDRLHVTVRFIGSSDEARLAAIRDALPEHIAASPFDLAVAGTGAFPRSGPPRVLWAGLTSGRDQLIEIERQLSGRLGRIGIPPEDRAFNPHLTLARVRDASGLRVAPLFDGLATRAFGTTRVDAITLFESHLSPKGPSYEVIQRSRLDV